MGLSSMWDKWVIDGSMGWPPCLCPIEGDLDGEFSIVTGMNFIGTQPPDGAKIVALVHPDGQDAADQFYAEHKDDIDRMLGKSPTKGERDNG